MTREGCGRAGDLAESDRGAAAGAARDCDTLGVRWPVLGGDALAGSETDGGPLAEGSGCAFAYLQDRGTIAMPRS